MKCKVCGSELTEGSLICKVCGSPIVKEQPAPVKTREAVRHVEDVDFNWNTYDFPKPKKPEDIEMTWPQFNVHQKIDADKADEQIAASIASRRPVSIMRNDAQEGFVFTNAAPVRPEPQVVPVVQYVPVQPVAGGAFSQTGPFAPVWTMPVQQPMPSAEPIWYTQSVAPVAPQGIPVQYVPVYAQPAGPYTIAMQRADGQIPGMPTKEEFAASSAAPDDEPVDENWIRAQLDPVPQEDSRGVSVFTNRIDAAEEPFKAFVFDEPENVADKEEPAAPVLAPELSAESSVSAEPLDAEPEKPVFAAEPVIESEPVIAEEPVTEEAPASEPVTAAEAVPAAEPVSEPVIAEEPATEETPVSEPVIAAEAVPAAEAVSEPAAAEETPVRQAPVAEIAAEEQEASRAERFYTFTRKNEEFQALLDAEYARVKAMRLGQVPADVSAASEPAAPVETKDSKITDTSDISAAMASVLTDIEEPEDDAPLTVEAIIKAGASDDPDATRVWNAAEEAPPVFKLLDNMLSQPEEINAEELSAFESMLMSGTSSRDETTDETMKISLSKVREAMVRPLADDVTVPDFVYGDAEEASVEKTAESAPVKPAVSSKEKAEEDSVTAMENEQMSLRKQRLEEMARAREEFFGSSLTPVTKPSVEVGTIASKKEPVQEKSAEEPRKPAETVEESAARIETVASYASSKSESSGEASDTSEAEAAPKTEKEDEPEEKGKNKKHKKHKAEEAVSGYEEYTKKDYSRGGSKILIFLLVIAVLALLLEGAEMMAARFMPGSTVSVFLTDLETDIFSAVGKFIDTVVEGFNLLFKK